MSGDNAGVGGSDQLMLTLVEIHHLTAPFPIYAHLIEISTKRDMGIEKSCMDSDKQRLVKVVKFSGIVTTSDSPAAVNTGAVGVDLGGERERIHEDLFKGTLAASAVVGVVARLQSVPCSSPLKLTVLVG